MVPRRIGHCFRAPVVADYQPGDHHRQLTRYMSFARVYPPSTITLRRFGQWAMAYVQREDLADELARLHSDERNPGEKSAMLSRLERTGDDALPEF